MIDTTPERESFLAKLQGLENQLHKDHWLNVHFRAFELANDAWQMHIRMNAITGSRQVHSPGGAVLDPERDDTEATDAD